MLGFFLSFFSPTEWVRNIQDVNSELLSVFVYLKKYHGCGSATVAQKVELGRDVLKVISKVEVLSCDELWYK